MRASDLPSGMNTETNEWLDPAQTNPPGLLATRTRVHPRGGITVRSDGDGSGLALGVLGNPAARDWPDGVPIVGVPARITGQGELWMPPYGTVLFGQATLAAIRVAAPTGKNGDTTVITSPIVVSITNPSPYRMLVRRHISVRAAKLLTPRKSVSYDLVVDGATASPWPILTGVPDRTVSVVLQKKTATMSIDNQQVQHAFVHDATVIDTTNPATHAGSTTLSLPSLLVDPFATYSMTVATAISYYEDLNDAFDVQIGETTAELVGWTMPTTDFGQEA